MIIIITAAWLAQLGERRSAEWEVVSSNPRQTNTQGLKITEEKVLPPLQQFPVFSDKDEKL